MNLEVVETTALNVERSDSTNSNLKKGTIMDKKKTVSTGVAMILYCICAIVWNINVMIDLAYGFPNALHIICAIAWDFSAVVWVVRYIRLKKHSNE